MKTKSFIAGILILASTLSHAATNDLSSTLQRGLFEEEANRNLDAAAQAYQTVSSQFDKDRALAATAIFRLGEIYRKQNKTNAAASQYERIVREFSDQGTLVTLSRQNFAGLGTSPRISKITEPNTSNQPNADAQLLTKLMALSRAELREVLPSISGDKVLIELIQQLNSSEAKFREQARDISEGHPEHQRSIAVQKLLNEKIDARVDGIMKAMEMRVSAASSANVQPGVENNSLAATTDEEEKEIRRIQAMIRNSPDLINSPSGEGGMTPLHTAARQGQLIVARFLLDNGANANSKDSAGRTSLTLAATAGHKAMAELLLSKGAEVDAHAAGGHTALHIAASMGFGGVAEVLLAHKANVNASSNDGGMTPLHFAAGSGHSAMMELLLRNGANANAVDGGGQTPLMYAAMGGHALAVKVLLSAKADVNAQTTSGRTALSYAAEKGHLDVVKTLLDGKANPNADSLDLPLAMAAQGKRLEVAECLLKAGADPNKRGKCSTDVSSPETPGFLGTGFGRRFGSASSGWFGPFLPLQIAVSQRDAGMVGLLLQFKADTNIEAPWAPARSLASYVLPNPDMLKSFLAAGVDVGATNLESWPLLLLACVNGNSAAVEMLLAHGANPNIQSRDGHWAIELAAKYKCVECVELLLKAKADVNVRDDLGATPLYWAVDASDKATVKLLLTHGANPNIANQNGETPLNRCKSGKTLSDVQMKEIAPLLREHGALDDLPDFSRIGVRRPSANYFSPAFQMDAKGRNEFSLLEAIALHYGFISSERNALWEVNASTVPSRFWQAAGCQFPDLNRVVILRPAAPGQQRIKMKINVAELLESCDCTQDVKLKPGDVIEIPEEDHPVNQKWPGFRDSVLSNLLHCVSRKVTISIKGTPTPVQLTPQFKLTNSLGPYGERLSEVARGSFMLKSVLAQSRLLRAHRMFHV